MIARVSSLCTQRHDRVKSILPQAGHSKLSYRYVYHGPFVPWHEFEQDLVTGSQPGGFPLYTSFTPFMCVVAVTA